jgi:hypothetical protein
MHYRNPFNWFFLLQYPLILIIFYFIMRLSNRYRQIYQWEGMIGIDCGSGYPEDPAHEESRYGRLACLRLDDGQVFYSES